MIGKVLGFIFKRKLFDELSNDNELQIMIEDGDNSLERLKKNVDKLEKKGYQIPKDIKKYLWYSLQIIKLWEKNTELVFQFGD